MTEALSQMFGRDGPLDTATVRERFEQLWRHQGDFNRAAALLTRYLAQPLSDSELAWAYMHLANAPAVAERAAEAVLLHETFEAVASRQISAPFGPVY